MTLQEKQEKISEYLYEEAYRLFLMTERLTVKDADYIEIFNKLRKKMKEVEEKYLSKNEWNLFENKTPAEKKYLLIKEEYTKKYMEKERIENWQKNLYSIGFRKGNKIYLYDEMGGLNTEIETLEGLYWKYIE